MSLELIIRPEAETEMTDAFDWYEERAKGLGSEFLLVVNATFQGILRHPRQYPVVYKTVRRTLLRRFPHTVFYISEEDRVVVIAVFHAKRNPKHWQERT